MHQLVRGGDHQLEHLFTPILCQGGRQGGRNCLIFIKKIIRRAKLNIMRTHKTYDKSLPEAVAQAQEVLRGKLQQGKKLIGECRACWSPDRDVKKGTKSSQVCKNHLRVTDRAGMEGCHACTVVRVLPVFVEVQRQIGWVTFCSSSKAKLDNPGNKP